jgi:hypothetical protein
MEAAMTAPDGNRRRTRRRRVGEHGIVSARVRPGYDVLLINVSAGGALVESWHRLLPGAIVELHLETSERRTAVRGRVLRCAVSRLRSTSVCYRGAIGFDRHLPWFADDESAGYAVPTSERRPGGPGRAEATHHVL